MRGCDSGRGGPPPPGDAVEREFLDAVRDGKNGKLHSPPGGGKSYKTRQGAAMAYGCGATSIVTCVTNGQALLLGKNLASEYRRARVVLLMNENVLRAERRDLERLSRQTRLMTFSSASEVMDDPIIRREDRYILVANSAKLTWMRGSRTRGVPHADYLIVDECFQLRHAGLLPLLPLAERYLLVGDPGQIRPFSTVEVSRWEADRAGPHRPGPSALAHLSPDVRTWRITQSRRLPRDTAAFISSAFYADMPFDGMFGADDRTLVPSSRIVGHCAIDRAIEAMAQGESLQSLWLPARVTGPTDEEIAGCIATLVRRLVELRWSVRDEGYEAEITPSDIAVVVSHRAEATAVRTRLPGGFEDVNVKTSDAIQGEERRIVIAQHPLSGREAMGAWDLEAGRLNVMLSRHRIGCFLFGREGIEHALDRYSPSGERVIGLDEDHEHEGWLANRRLLDRLRSERRLRYLGTAA